MAHDLDSKKRKDAKIIFTFSMSEDCHHGCIDTIASLIHDVIENHGGKDIIDVLTEIDHEHFTIRKEDENNDPRSKATRRYSR